MQQKLVCPFSLGGPWGRPWAAPLSQASVGSSVLTPLPLLETPRFDPTEEQSQLAPLGVMLHPSWLSISCSPLSPAAWHSLPWE